MLFSDMTKLFKLKYVNKIDLFYIGIRYDVRDAEDLDPENNLSEIKTLVTEMKFEMRLLLCS